MDPMELNGRAEKVAELLTHHTPLDHRFCERLARVIIATIDTPASGTPIAGFDQGIESPVSDGALE